ncbi:hypothetical protein UY3_13254 [Chelonia mydas]|uniref:Uncharacterized protein n=1 Tax=Chelonia mydas TaxID=8469 RepID=M7AVT3_CHEMY|nr:hypothetical protein UY3_13254 [Chelonia mydas]
MTEGCSLQNGALRVSGDTEQLLRRISKTPRRRPGFDFSHLHWTPKSTSRKIWKCLARDHNGPDSLQQAPEVYISHPAAAKGLDAPKWQNAKREAENENIIGDFTQIFKHMGVIHEQLPNPLNASTMQLLAKYVLAPQTVHKQLVVTWKYGQVYIVLTGRTPKKYVGKG